jgi:hypothetical protein
VLSADGKSWIPARKNFLFHVKALSKTFRGKFLEHLQAAHAEGKLSFPGKLAALKDADAFQRFVWKLRKKQWVIYMKRPFAGARQVLEYLARYTHRVAITNDRIRDVKDGRVTFSYKKRLGDDRHIVADETLSAHEFIRRFLLHVVPNGFMKIRHFGFLANKCKRKALAAIRASVGAAEQSTPEHSPEELMRVLANIDIAQCPRCRTGRMKAVSIIPRMKMRRDHDPPPREKLKCA